MTESDLSTRACPTEGPLGKRWRAEAERAQESVVPSGRTVITCSAPPGVGGLGRHLKEVDDAIARTGERAVCISGSTREGESSERRRPVRVPSSAELLSRLPIPLSPALRTRASMVEFDVYARDHLPAADHLIAFNGQALGQFRAARRARYESRCLVAANSHLRNVIRQHAKARRRYPFEGSWATRLLGRNLSEYAQADRIYVASEYTRQSFLQEGVASESLLRFHFTPDPRYRLCRASRRSGTFNIVYVGNLTVVKGVPLLVDAVRRLGHSDIRLALVGGWSTRGMRRFLGAACTEDPRISTGPGDPLSYLSGASLYVHASYEDGFAYAPAEALACGVPVIASEDTGMKELIDPSRTGVLLPTGDLDALTEAIDAAYRGDLLDA